MIGQGIRRLSDRFTPFLRALAYLAVGSDGQVLTLSSGKPVWGDVALGVGQSWQDVKASRSQGTPYQNTTGRSIQVAIQTNDIAAIQVSSNGTTWLDIGIGVSGLYHSMARFVVPPGHYYKSTGAGGLKIWLELR